MIRFVEKVNENNYNFSNILGVVLVYQVLLTLKRYSKWSSKLILARKVNVREIFEQFVDCQCM